MADSQRIEDLRRRVQKDPASIAFAQLAEECRRAGNHQEAVDVCRAGLELHPGYLSARVTLGRALIELNDLDTARGELEHVLRSAPENLAAIRGLAEIHHRQGSLAGALAQSRAGLGRAPNDPDLQQTVAEPARQIEPPPPPASADGLSFEQMESEFLANLPAPPPRPAAQAAPAAPAPVAAAPAAAPPVASADRPATAPVTLAVPAPVPVTVAVEQVPASVFVSAPPPDVRPEPLVEDTAERDRALQVVAVLNQWLDAIHVTRAQPVA